MGQATASSLRRSKTPIYALWAAGAVGAAATLLKGWDNPIANRDFASLWVAGKLAAQGHAFQVYDLAALKAAAAASVGTNFNLAFPYPPHLLLLGVPLSFLPITVSFVVWQAISGAFFFVAARSYLPNEMPKVLVLLTPAVLINLAFGQVGLFIGAMWLFAFSGSAIAAACLTMKPHVGFLAVFEVGRRHRMLVTFVVAAVLIAASVLLFGIDTWRAFFTSATTSQFEMIRSGSHPNWYAQMVTPLIGYGIAGWLVFSGGAILLLVLRFNVFTAATATFLIAPYGFHYDLTVVCLGFGILLFQNWKDLPPWQTFVCALAFLAPVFVRAGTWLVPPILLAGLYVLTTFETETAENGSVFDVRNSC